MAEASRRSHPKPPTRDGARASRALAAAVLGAMFLACPRGTRAQAPPPEPAATLPGGAPAAAPGGKPQYVGAGSCGASTCHGSVRPRSDTRILQNEYAVWTTKDRHAKAYAVLSDKLAVRIAKNLGLASATDGKCTACHALDVPASEKARPFDKGDGVGCESCHGPASQWIGPHFSQGWTHAQSVALGMVETKDVARRVARCVTCHVGDDAKFVDHEMIAAGHPDLFFELDAFMAAMPMHWKEPRDAGRGVLTWSVGQGAHLKAALERLAGRARGKTWPEYAELDCYACHHALTTPEESWRQERGFAGRKPGNIPYNLSRWATFRVVAEKVDPAGAKALDGEMTKLAAIVSTVSPSREETAAAAARAIDALDPVLRKVASSSADRAAAVDLIGRIGKNADWIAGTGERGAEQAAMSLDSLIRHASADGELANTQAVKTELDALFAQLAKPSAYDSRKAAESIRKIGGMVH